MWLSRAGLERRVPPVNLYDTEIQWVRTVDVLRATMTLPGVLEKVSVFLVPMSCLFSRSEYWSSFKKKDVELAA